MTSSLCQHVTLTKQDIEVGDQRLYVLHRLCGYVTECSVLVILKVRCRNKNISLSWILTRIRWRVRLTLLNWLTQRPTIPILASIPRVRVSMARREERSGEEEVRSRRMLLSSVEMLWEMLESWSGCPGGGEMAESQELQRFASVSVSFLQPPTSCRQLRPSETLVPNLTAPLRHS